MDRLQIPPTYSCTPSTPRVQGWIGAVEEGWARPAVNPTRIGMDPLDFLYERYSERQPHAYRDGSSLATIGELITTVNPTRIGMDRLPSRSPSSIESQPHAYRDGSVRLTYEGLIEVGTPLCAKCDDAGDAWPEMELVE